MAKKDYQLIIITGLLLFTGLLGISITTYLVSSSALRRHITQAELPMTGDNVYSEIQRDLLKPTFVASLMATDTFLKDWVILGEQDTRKIAHYLEEIKSKYNAFSSFFVSNNTKRYYYSGGVLKTVQKTEKRDDWYFRISEADADYEINLDQDLAAHDTMTIFINHKVYDYDGNYLGAAGVGLAIHGVKKLINTYQKRYKQTIFFTDKTGKITLHGHHFSKQVKNIFEIKEIDRHRQSIYGGPSQSFQYRQNGKTIYANNRFIPEFGWYLFVEQPGNKAIEEVHNTLVTNLIFSFAITCLILIAAGLTLTSFQRRLTRLETTDKLTGIYNRQPFDIIIDQSLKDINREETSLSIILFDIDHFKIVNDTHGHLAGDCVIQNTVQTAARIIRNNDILCRWGDKEFLILLKRCNLDNGLKVAEKIRTAVESKAVLYQKEQFNVTISAGVAESSDCDTKESLLKRADKALFLAKARGQNSCEAINL
ncbi:MAG: sensor domain-containing diguanylate cyclase [Desulfobacterium sp.]|nr:sensor domain-containing diguanylate cyclase [Desulfobacterium sp.]